MEAPEDRIALFLDFENLAIGAREDLGGLKFDLRPVADALAERGRVISRRAYGDWNLFEEFWRSGVESSRVGHTATGTSLKSSAGCSPSITSR